VLHDTGRAHKFMQDATSISIVSKIAVEEE